MDDPAQQTIDDYRDQLFVAYARIEEMQRDLVKAGTRMRAMERALRRAHCCCPDPECVAHEDWCPMVDVLAKSDAEVRQAQ